MPTILQPLEARLPADWRGQAGPPRGGSPVAELEGIFTARLQSTSP